MLRILLTALCLGTSFFCFSVENLWEKYGLPKESEPFLYIGYGMGSVLLHNHDAALEYLTTAESLLSNADGLKPAGAFMIAFTRAVAYDNLGWQDYCEREIGRLILIAAEYGEDDVFEATIEGNEVIVRMLTDVASRAPTYAVRKFLLYISEDEDEDTTATTPTLFTLNHKGLN